MSGDKHVCEPHEAPDDTAQSAKRTTGLGSLTGEVLVGGVRFYQLVIRPFLPPSCRFHPSCSEYFIEAVRKYGPISGAFRGTWRICRCHPWNAGGYDPP